MKYLGILSAFKQIAFYVPREVSKTGSGKHFPPPRLAPGSREVRGSESYILTFLQLTLKVLVLLFLEAIS